eukprot:542320_1
MGCCVSLGDNESELNAIDANKEHVKELKQPLSATPEIEKELIEIKIDDIDPWEYSNSLAMNEVTDMLKDITFDNCKPFVAPIKYAKCVKVYDGDTVHIAAPLFNEVIARFRVRLARIDCPELRTKDEWEKKAGYIVKEILENKIGNKIIELTNVKYDKYGRILSEIILNGENINDWLLDSDWACPYEGKGEKLVKKTDWKSKVIEYQNDIQHET